MKQQPLQAVNQNIKPIVNSGSNQKGKKNSYGKH